MLNYSTQNPECQGIFSVLENLRERKLEQEKLLPHLIKAFKIQDHYTESKKERIAECGSFFEISPSGKIVSANFCKNRFCPICQWRLSVKTFGKVATLQDAVERDFPQYQYIFVTFTLENSKTLSEGLQAVLKGFNNLTHDRTFRKAQKGFIRSIEVTYNSEYETWHPHVHTVLAVAPEYFMGGYLNHDAWQALWARATKIDYKPFVDVRAVYNDRYRAVAEIVKYSVKPFDIQASKSEASDIYSELIENLYNRRLRSFGGIYKKLARDIGLCAEISLTDESRETGMFFVFDNGKYILSLGEGQFMDMENGEVVKLSNITKSEVT